MTIQIFVIEDEDNVATNVADEIPPGTTLESNGRAVNAIDTIPYGHKVALQPIARGEPVLKYGLSIGTATTDIQAGQHVHVHNVESNRGRGDLHQGEE